MFIVKMHMIATPARVDFSDMRDKSPPRIISVVRKNHVFSSQSNYRAKLTDDILLKRGNERNWWPRRVFIRCGQLVVSSHGADGPSSFKLSLRHMSLQAGPVANSFSLCKGQNIILTLQTSTRRTFNEWVKAVAIELIRQTPLGDVKYLDILTFQDNWNLPDRNCDRDWNFNDKCASQSNSGNPCDICDKNRQFNNSYPSASPLRTDSSLEEDVAIQAEYVQDLLKKCQSTENYVPVKEKLFLFESLCKLGRKVRSTEDVPSRVNSTSGKRAKSLNDLTHHVGAHGAVREICKYFENKNNESYDSRSSFKIQRLGQSYNHLDLVNKYVEICNN